MTFHNPAMFESCGQDRPAAVRLPVSGEENVAAEVVRRGHNPFRDIGKIAASSHDERPTTSGEQAYLCLLLDSTTEVERLDIGLDLIAHMNIGIRGRRPTEVAFQHLEEKFYEACGYGWLYAETRSEEWTAQESDQHDAIKGSVNADLHKRWRVFFENYGGTSDDRIAIRNGLITQLENTKRELASAKPTTVVA